VKRREVLHLLEKLKDLKILVVGDVILDRYLYGRVERISPEAPVPVVEVEGEEVRLGGRGSGGRGQGRRASGEPVEGEGNKTSFSNRCETHNGENEDHLPISAALEDRLRGQKTHRGKSPQLHKGGCSLP